MTYLLAVLAACANATSSVLQRKAGRNVPKRQNLSLKLVWSLAHEPVWFGGILAVIAGFLLQAAALGGGDLSVVEPILVFELPATLILASRVFGTRMRAREWGAATGMTAGLAALIYLLSPAAGRPESVRWYTWAAGIGVNLAFVAVMVGWGRRGPASPLPIPSCRSCGASWCSMSRYGAAGTSHWRWWPDSSWWRECSPWRGRHCWKVSPRRRTRPRTQGSRRQYRASVLILDISHCIMRNVRGSITAVVTGSCGEGHCCPCVKAALRS